jgi:hypothetical protein
MDERAVTPAIDTGALLARAERVTLRASLIFDVTDGYASQQMIAGPRPRPLGDIRFSFTESGPGTPTVQKLDPPLTLVTLANPSGYSLWFGHRVDGGPVPDPGTYQLRVDGDYYAPFLAPNPVTVPTSASSIECPLQPGYAYPFAEGGLTAPGTAPTLLRGALQSFDGTGQAGTTVAVTIGASTLKYLTDSTGQFVLVLPDPVPPSASVDITDSAGNQTTVPNVALSPGGTAVLPQTVLTGRVVTTVIGAIVQLKTPPATVGVAPDGSWRIVLPPGRLPATVSLTANVQGQLPKSVSRIKVTPGQVVPVAPFVFSP